MAKSGTLGRIAAKTVAAGREHVAEVLKGAETLPEAIGGAVEDLLSGPKARPSSKATAEKAVKKKEAVKKKRAKKLALRGKKSQSK